MRLIDATRLVKLALLERDKIPLIVKERNGFGTESPNHHGQSMRGGIRKILRLIEQAPTIDAVPVIRCLACAWRSPTGFCGRHGHPVADDFFCANGTTEIIKKPGPAKKKAEKKTEERCGATGLPCSRCVPGPCDHRRTVIPDESGQ